MGVGAGDWPPDSDFDRAGGQNLCCFAQGTEPVFHDAMSMSSVQLRRRSWAQRSKARLSNSPAAAVRRVVSSCWGPSAIGEALAPESSKPCARASSLQDIRCSRGSAVP
jgi:hypothetical protein